MRTLTILPFLLFLGSVDAAQVYKCIDQAGKVTFGQVPCGGVLEEQPSEQVNEPAANKVSSESAVRVIYPAPEGSEENARRAISLKLKDPDSLQIRNIVATGISPDPEKWVICGEYNARNSFGGYVGFHKFSLVDGKAFLGGDDIEAILVNVTCK